MVMKKVTKVKNALGKKLTKKREGAVEVIAIVVLCAVTVAGCIKYADEQDGMVSAVSSASETKALSILGTSGTS